MTNMKFFASVAVYACQQRLVFVGAISGGIAPLSDESPDLTTPSEARATAPATPPVLIVSSPDGSKSLGTNSEAPMSVDADTEVAEKIAKNFLGAFSKHFLKPSILR